MGIARSCASYSEEMQDKEATIHWVLLVAVHLIVRKNIVYDIYSPGAVDGLCVGQVRSSSVSLSYFNLAVPMRKCLGTKVPEFHIFYTIAECNFIFTPLLGPTVF